MVFSARIRASNNRNPSGTSRSSRTRKKADALKSFSVYNDSTCPSVALLLTRRVSRRTRYFADKTLVARSHSANDAGSYRRPPTGYRLSRFVDSINNKRSRYVRNASANFLLVGYRKLNGMALSRFLLKQRISGISVYKNFRTTKFPTNLRKRGYRIFHLRRMDPFAFCTQSHFSRMFLTGIFLHTPFYMPTHKPLLTSARDFHWHSTSRGEFHLYANLKPRAHFCIPPWDPVETCPMQCTLGLRSPEEDERDESIFREATWAKNFRPLLSGGQIRPVQFVPEIDGSI